MNTKHILALVALAGALGYVCGVCYPIGAPRADLSHENPKTLPDIPSGGGSGILAAQKASDGIPMARLLDAIEQVESGGRADAIGDGGNAVGAYQIWPAYWQDGCESLGVNWPLSDRLDRDKSRAVTRAYLLRYGKNKTVEQLARIHNGGPSGHRKTATLPYWEKVRKELLTSNRKQY